MSSGTRRIDVRNAPVAARGLQEVGQRRALRAGVKSSPRMRTSGSALLSGATTARERLLDHQRLHRCVGQDVDLLRDGKPPVERNQHRAESRAGIKQHEVVGMIGGEDRNAVAAADACLRFQRPRRRCDAPGKAGIGERRAHEADRRLVRRERGIAVDEIGKVHGALRAIRSRTQAVTRPFRPAR